MFHILRLATFFGLFVTSVHAMDPENDILEALHKSGHPTVTRSNISRMPGNGSNTTSLWYIEGKNFVCKELKDNKEIQNLANLDSFVTQHESQPSSKHISFGRYRGALKDDKRREYALFNCVTGKSVFSYMLEWAPKGYNWQGHNPLQIKGCLFKDFENIGDAIANFHLKYGTFDEKTSTFTTCIHGDLHLSNIFYDAYKHFINNRKVTFIDYETMQTKEDISKDIIKLFSFSKEQVKNCLEKQAIDDFPHIQPAKDLKTLTKEYLERADDFFASLEKGYTQAFENAGYICNIRTGKVEPPA